MARGDFKQQERLPEEIRRQFFSPGVRRFAGSLPGFEVEKSLPGKLETLLEALDRAEKSARGPG